MKEREKTLLTYLIEHRQATIKQLMEMFQISKRTLYYDIESLNYFIRGNGQIKNIDGSICYIGKARSLHEVLHDSHQHVYDLQDRKHYILYKILLCEKITIERLAEELQVSKNTIVQTMEEITTDLAKRHLKLKRKPNYELIGDEFRIRNLFLILMQEDNNLLNQDVHDIRKFDEQAGLFLSDYATYTLTKFLFFLKLRYAQGAYVSEMCEAHEIRLFSYFKHIDTILPNVPETEKIYVGAYIASLPSLDPEIMNERIDETVDILIKRFEAASAIKLDSCDEFKKNIRHHLISSYYRIKYRFPISNPSLDEIKQKHEALFSIISRILENEQDFPDFKGIREEEIGFIAAYFGGYLKGSKQPRRNKVLLVCPHGLMVSKSLEVQLYRFIPTIHIVDSIALKDLANYHETYDYIISTIEIVDHKNVIVVNPMLTRFDIDHVMNKLLHIQSGYIHVDLDDIVESIKRNADIKDERQLRKDLERAIFKEKEKERYQPMLKDLISESRIQVVEHVQNWKEAIQIASSPLLQEGVIEQTYVEAMIESVEEHGPYIVLADYFALPHASSASGVHALSMALLVVKEEVDLLGKPVRLFMVLATTDTMTHMKALATLSEILYDQANIALFCKGDKKAILEVIQSNSGN